MNRQAHQFGKGIAFLSPWLIGFLVFTLAPIALSFYYSLCKFNALQPPKFVGARNYIDLLHDKVFWLATGNTFYYVLLALPSGLMVSLGLAMLLNVDIPGKALWRTIIFMPSLVPGSSPPRCSGCGCSTRDSDSSTFSSASSASTALPGSPMSTGLYPLWR